MSSTPMEALYPVLKKALFRMNPEEAHEFTLKSLRRAERSKVLALTSKPLQGESVECMGLTFPNRVGLAAGMDKEGNTIDALGRLGFGFIEVGTFTPSPQAGNLKPRMFRLPDQGAIINRMGFNNPGVEEGIQNVSQASTYKGIIGVNIGKNKNTPNSNATEDYLVGLRESYAQADYVTINLSSPNTPGLRDLQNEEDVKRLLEVLHKEQKVLEKKYERHVPIALKVAPDLTDKHIAELAQVFLDQGLEGVIATNTTLDRKKINTHPLAYEIGGLSGAPVTAQSTHVIEKFYEALGGKIPIVGVGGIMTGQDAQDKLEAGATLVQLYTGFVYNGPKLIKDCIKATSR